MKKKIFVGLAALAALVLAWNAFQARYVVIRGKLYDRQATVAAVDGGLPEDLDVPEAFPHLRWLDLRETGLTPAQLQAAQTGTPGIQLLWTLRFQGQRVDGRAKTVQVRHLTDADVDALCCLPALRRVDGQLCRDYPQLLALRQRLPQCRVEYTVALGGVCMSGEEPFPAPGPCTRAQIENALDLLPRAERIDLRGTGLLSGEARRLADDYPQCAFLWKEAIGDCSFSTDVTELDLSGIPLTGTEGLEELLPYLTRLQKLVACDCGLESKTMASLAQRYPKIRFVWRVKLGPLSARTDDTWFAPITKGQLIGGSEADELKYCTDMECIDLGHCWIRNCNWAQNMKKLRYLVLADTYVRDLSPLSGLKNLAYLELFVTPVRDYSPLLGCTGLEDLNLGYTYGDPAPIAKMTWLRNLWWGGIHHVPWYRGEDPAALLRQGLPNTKLMFYAGSSTGLGWRELPHYYEMRDRIGMYYMRG